MTGQEIIDKLKSVEGYRLEDLGYETFIPDELKEDLGEVEETYQFGGEGKGDTWYAIKYFPKHNVYLKVNGWYASHYGSELYGWDEVRVVAPKEKTITVYE